MNAALSTEPGFGEVLEVLRENRRLPETVDFRNLINVGSQTQLLGIIEPIEDLLHLPDEPYVAPGRSAASVRRRGGDL